MKILQINNFHYLRGGSERYYFDISNLLERNGHEVLCFSMKHPKNLLSRQDGFFVSNIDFGEMAGEINLYNGLKVISRTVYSFEAKRNLDRLIKRERPQLLHIQNFHHQLSPSVLYSAKSFNLPVVWTVHDYESICPNALFLNNNSVCEDCEGGKYYMVISNRCKKGSLPASVVAALTFYTHRALRIYKLIDYFLTPSNFLRNKLVEYGFDPAKTVHIPNFINVENIVPDYSHSNYYLYLGRLSREKGIFTLLKAVKSLKIKEKLKIVGEGPLREEIIKYIKTNKLENTVEMLGYHEGEELENIIKKAMFVVLPSECYENFPYVVLEAFAYGKPVIGANMGGIPEQIEEGVNGYLFESGDACCLARKISLLINEKNKVKEMGENARNKAEQKYNSHEHYNALMAVYEKSISNESKKIRNYH